MFTVKITYTTRGNAVTDIIECVSPRITKSGAGTFVYLHGGDHGGLNAYVGVDSIDGGALHAHSIIIENASGRTTEIFRDHRDIEKWRAELSGEGERPDNVNKRSSDELKTYSGRDDLEVVSPAA